MQLQLIRMVLVLVLVLCQPLTAVVAAASEATRGFANERFESFERPPVNSPTYVAGQPSLAVGEHSSLKSPRAQPSRIDYETPPQRYLRMTH